MDARPAVTSRDLSADDYTRFSEFLERSCGILLGEHKHYLVSSRLAGLMGEFRVASVGELLNRLAHEPRSGLRERVIDAMTTNETLWFRDRYPFEILKERLFPGLAGKRPVRVWSAACSSGQEPYSISICAQEYLLQRPGGLQELQIVGTDISPAMLRVAQEARYDRLAVARGLSDERLKRFFLPLDGGWQVRPEVRARVSFRELNLLGSYALLGRFDLIFCRNVLIYFSPALKRQVLERLGQALNPGGHLVLGASESIPAEVAGFEMIRCNPGVIYRRR